jgi:hypothetical protein
MQTIKLNTKLLLNAKNLVDVVQFHREKVEIKHKNDLTVLLFEEKINF